MGKEKLNLFQFASTTMTLAGASAAKIMGWQIRLYGLFGAPLHRIPDYVGCHASVLSRSTLQKPSEYFSVAHSRMPEPGIDKLLALRWHRDRS